MSSLRGRKSFALLLILAAASALRIVEPQQDAVLLAGGMHNGYPMRTVHFLIDLRENQHHEHAPMLEFIVKWQDDVKTTFPLTTNSSHFRFDMTLNDLGSYFCHVRLLDGATADVLAHTSVSFEITRNASQVYKPPRRLPAALPLPPANDSPKRIKVAFVCDVGDIDGFKLQLLQQLKVLSDGPIRATVIDLSCIHESSAAFLKHLAPLVRVVRLCLQIPQTRAWPSRTAFVDAAMHELQNASSTASLSRPLQKVFQPLIDALLPQDVLAIGNSGLARNESGTSAYIISLARLLGIPIVLDLGARGPNALPEASLRSSIALTIAPSEFVSDGARRRLPRTPSATIAPIVNTTLFSRARALKECRTRRFASNDSLVIAYIGRISSEKGPGMFVRAAAAMQSMLPNTSSNVRFVMIGRGKLKQDVEALARRLRVPVEFTGFVPHKELPCDLIDIDVLVFITPIDETFGLAAFEAMLMRTAVVAFPSGGSQAFLKDDETAIVVKTQTPQAVAAALIDLASTPRRLDRIARNAQHYALVSFSSQRARPMYERAYRWAASKPPREPFESEAARVLPHPDAVRWMIALRPCENYLDAQLAYNKGTRMMWSDGLRRAIELLETSAACNWGDICGALLNLGAAYKRAGAKPKAKDALLKAHACTEDNDFRVHAHLGTLLRQMGDFEAAERHLRRALDLEPHHVDTTKALGYLFVQRCARWGGARRIRLGY